MPYVLDILIPTYNRAGPLKRNLELILAAIGHSQLEEQVRILVSDNASTDGTRAAVVAVAEAHAGPIEYFANDRNLGLESNVVNVLARASSPYVMFLGDDDYLPNGYIEHVVRTLSNRPSRPLGFIPGFSGLLPDGTVRPSRIGRPIATEPHWLSALRLASLGHQLSGLVLPRTGLLDKYLSVPELRNIYPFIFFLGHTLIHYDCQLLPHFQVLVSQGNTKDWEYDDSGLISEVAKSYRAVFGHSVWYTLAMGLFIWRNPWRLRIGPSLRPSIRALRHLSQSDHVGGSLVALVSIILPLLYTRHMIGRFLRSARRNR